MNVSVKAAVESTRSSHRILYSCAIAWNLLTTVEQARIADPPVQLTRQ